MVRAREFIELAEGRIDMAESSAPNQGANHFREMPPPLPTALSARAR